MTKRKRVHIISERGGVKSGHTKIRSPASAETDDFYCLEVQGCPWPAAVD